jgi:uncharacterized protein
MSDTMTNAREFDWILKRFAEETAGVEHVVALSSDGLLLASSTSISRDDGEQLSAVMSGLQALGIGVCERFDQGNVEQIMIEMTDGYLFGTAISLGASLCVLAHKDCDMGLIAYEMALLCQRTASALSPALIVELKNQAIAS